MEDVDEEAHADSVDLRWQRFLIFEYAVDKKIPEMDETVVDDISADETGLDVIKEIGPEDLIALILANTSSGTEPRLTKVTTNSAADVGNPAVEPKVEMVEEDTVGEPMVLQGSSSQPGVVDAVERTDGGLLAQMRELLANNAESMSNIAKLNTAQIELTMSEVENNLVNEMAKNKANGKKTMSKLM